MERLRYWRPWRQLLIRLTLPLPMHVRGRRPIARLGMWVGDRVNEYLYPDDMEITFP